MSDNIDKEFNNNSIKQNLKKIFFLFALLIIFVGVSFCVYFLHYESLKNAKLEYNSVNIFSKISGQIVELNFENNAPVIQGEIIAKIDSKEYETKIEQLEKKLKTIEKKLKNSSGDTKKMLNEVSFDKSELEKAKGELENANSDYVRYKNAYQDGSVTISDLKKAQKNLEIANNNYIKIQSLFKKDNSILKTNNLIKNSQNIEIKKISEDIEKAKLDLSYTNIIAPIDGVIKYKNIKSGDRIQADTPIFEINNIYVYAETYSGNNKIKIGQKAYIKIKNKTYKGKIISIDEDSEPVNCIKAPCKNILQRKKIKMAFSDDLSELSIKNNEKIKVKIRIK